MRPTRPLTLFLALAVHASAADAPPLALTNAEGWSVSTAEAVLLNLSRPLAPGEGRLAVLVGTTDWTELFSLRGASVTFVPGAASLPAGATEVSVYLVKPGGEWAEIGRAPVTITAPVVTPRALQPALDLAWKTQFREGHRPETNAPPRETFRDGSFQLALQADGHDPSVARKGSVQVVGTTYQNEALRFATEGEDAPLVDLAGYGAEVARGRARLAAGGLNLDGQRHLLGPMETRGLTATVPLGRPADLSVSMASGTNIVGWSNPLGVGVPEHRILAGQLAVEMVPARPGALRVEAHGFDSSLLAQPAVNEGAVLDTARSKGIGGRLSASDPSGRLRVEGTYARSRFENTADAELEQGLPVAADEPTDGDARFARIELDAVRFSPPGRLPVTLTLTAEHEHADPLYRSVGAAARADQGQNAWGAILRLGEGTLQFVHARARDNLGEVASMLTTATDRDGLDVTLPLATLAARDGLASPWLPQITYAFARVAQVGAGVPVNGDFAPSHVPDQDTRTHNAAALWQAGSASFGYTLATSAQDNRQPGRENADFAQQTHQVALAYARSERLDASLELQLERARNEEVGQTDRLRRVGVRVNHWLPRGFGLTAVLGASWKDAEGAARTARNVEADLSAWWRLAWLRSRKAPHSTLFLRWATQKARAQDPVFAIDTDTSAWQLSAGINVSAF